jgi:gamma-glutamylcyclotransferase (GGCT)/AIG2-like uncharacterized protein YtfP
MIYFAYGSNLDSRDLRWWCESRGVSFPLEKTLGPAWLPDRELAFTVRSNSRNGGVLDVVPRDGHVVQGMLFEVPDARSHVLDMKENASDSYRRQCVRVMTGDGREVEAVTYVACERNRENHIPPDPSYVQVVSRGLAEHGLDEKRLRDAAKGRDVSSLAPRIFVYGTLLAGQHNHHLIEDHHTDMQTAVLPGRLIHLGGFPGLLPAEEDTDLISGEVYSLKDFDRVLDSLDELGGRHGPGNRHNLFHRVLVRAQAKKRRVLCWTWFYNGDGGDPIETGSWRDLGRCRLFSGNCMEAQDG